MKSDTSASSNPSGTDPGDPYESLERALRHPTPVADEALCTRIMESVRHEEVRSTASATARHRAWVPSWVSASAALAGAAAIVLLFWVRFSPNGADMPVENGATAATSPQAGPELDRLISDTREIAAFLQANVRL